MTGALENLHEGPSAVRLLQSRQAYAPLDAKADVHPYTDSPLALGKAHRGDGDWGPRVTDGTSYRDQRFFFSVFITELWSVAAVGEGCVRQDSPHGLGSEAKMLTKY